jgi:hypothetical protein
LRHPGLSDLFDLGSGIDKDRPEYTVFTGEWEVGRIYETRGGPDNLRWFWSMTVNGPMTRSDRVALGTAVVSGLLAIALTIRPQALQETGARSG